MYILYTHNNKLLTYKNVKVIAYIIKGIIHANSEEGTIGGFYIDNNVSFCSLYGVGYDRKDEFIVEGDSSTTRPFLVDEVYVDRWRTVRCLCFCKNKLV